MTNCGTSILYLKRPKEREKKKKKGATRTRPWTVTRSVHDSPFAFTGSAVHVTDEPWCISLITAAGQWSAAAFSWAPHPFRFFLASPWPRLVAGKAGGRGRGSSMRGPTGLACRGTSTGARHFMEAWTPSRRVQRRTHIQLNRQERHSGGGSFGCGLERAKLSVLIAPHLCVHIRLRQGAPAVYHIFI